MDFSSLVLFHILKSNPKKKEYPFTQFNNSGSFQWKRNFFLTIGHQFGNALIFQIIFSFSLWIEAKNLQRIRLQSTGAILLSHFMRYTRNENESNEYGRRDVEENCCGYVCACVCVCIGCLSGVGMFSNHVVVRLCYIIFGVRIQDETLFSRIDWRYFACYFLRTAKWWGTPIDVQFCFSDKQ